MLLAKQLSLLNLNNTIFLLNYSVLLQFQLKIYNYKNNLNLHQIKKKSQKINNNKNSQFKLKRKTKIN